MYYCAPGKISKSKVVLAELHTSQPLNRQSPSKRYALNSACKFSFPNTVAKSRKLPAMPPKEHGWTQEIAASYKPKMWHQFSAEFFDSAIEISTADERPLKCLIEVADIVEKVGVSGKGQRRLKAMVWS